MQEYFRKKKKKKKNSWKKEARRGDWRVRKTGTVEFVGFKRGFGG